MQLVSTLVCAAALGLPFSSCGGDTLPPTQPTLPGSCPAVTAVVPALITAAPPTHAAANYAGTWSGQYHVIGCSRACGLGPSVCDAQLVPPGATFPLRLTVTQADAIVSGTLDLFDNTGRVVVESGQVTGTIDSSDALLLFGTTHTSDPSEHAQTMLSDWKSVLTEAGNAMSGRFTQNRAFQNFWGPQQIKEDCELMNFRRAPS